ncbi:MAG: DUF1844 domain-containing protein [Planctomycetota bacterium]|nr:MAG: DUF1844 domain-containing protein [Planctomycetota bacterium]REJ90310.1 MAG: DUF1844 domain-containing protein [Planctomycetota bacterium]REJ95621.1 MAG: DUF1844 domain-containing protein [Planctomycetota bacterium]REK25183.1 MAG: DUF1844 domain-containing protein [Planctomycetota bacterium]REK40949.1 MAG: DUF1844 domain-containing protein [Planctomycetota bacterium]
MPGSPEEKKLIIDEDWKSQVEAEKEAAETARSEEPDADAGAGAGALPPADFRTLVSMLATQAMMSMGAVPHPLTGRPEVHPEQARHFIDLLGVLQEKTKGNLSDEEDTMMDGLMSELRMAFVAGGSGPMAPPTEEPDAS